MDRADEAGPFFFLGNADTTAEGLPANTSPPGQRCAAYESRPPETRARCALRQSFGRLSYARASCVGFLSFFGQISPACAAAWIGQMKPALFSSWGMRTQLQRACLRTRRLLVSAAPPMKAALRKLAHGVRSDSPSGGLAMLALPASASYRSAGRLSAAVPLYHGEGRP